MQIDFIDTFYIHWPRQGIDLAAAMEELGRQKERGRIRRIGLCNVTREQVQIAERGAPVDTVQFGYNLIWRKPELQELTTLPQRRIAYSVLAQGLLARTFAYEPTWDGSDHRPRTPLFRTPVWDAVHEYQRRYIAECQRYGLSPAAVAVSWAAERVDGVLAGARTINQLDSLVDGLESVREHPAHLNQLLSSVTASSTELQDALPDLPNMFGYVPTPCRNC
jgi:aryl-alcohol dehydrogenase-like predicted oxidoreductase